jgi:hypothetical protein
MAQHPVTMPDEQTKQANLATVGEGEIPESESGGTMEAPPLVIGAPFALSHDCELLSKDQGPPGCVAVVQCDDCSQKFKIDLLSDGVKHCPKCRNAFTHCLLVARTDDTEIVPRAMAIVLQANGYDAPGQGEDDDDEDEDDQGDEVQDADE